MLARAPLLSCALACLAVSPPAAASAPQETARAERTLREEGEAIIALADAVMKGEPPASDFSLQWRNDYLKAQQGTFVPFVVTIDAPALASVLLYVRLAARDVPAADASRGRRSGKGGARRADPEYAVEEVYPIEMRAASNPARIARGFSARAGDYDLIVVARERPDPRQPGGPARAAVLARRLTLPDFRPDELTTSSVILADRLTVLDTAPADEQSEGRPYLIGLSDIQPAADNRLRQDEELIVVFLVYNPSVTPEKKFDIEVEYHFFSKTGDPRDRDGPREPGAARPPARDGERYFNRTKPQRFTPAIMGPQFDPAAGHPLMAGQGVPLAAFPQGEYRLAIKVTDIVTGKSIVRDLEFAVDAAR